MRRSRFSAEQISTALRQVESGAPVAEVTRKLGISEKTYHLWKKQYAHLLTIDELRELRQLHDENAKLKRLVADLAQDKAPCVRIVVGRIEPRTEEPGAMMRTQGGSMVTPHAQLVADRRGDAQSYLTIRVPHRSGFQRPALW